MPPEPSRPEPPHAVRPAAHSVDLLQALLENAPDSIYFKDRESRFTLISRHLARLLGLADPQEAYGKTDRDFFSAEHAEQALADERRVLATGEPIIDFVEKETWPDGRITWAATTKLPLRNAAGQIVGTFGISRDVTARIAAEQRLRTTHRDLIEASQRAAAAEAACEKAASVEALAHDARQKVERLQQQLHDLGLDAIRDLAAQLGSRRPEAGDPLGQLIASLGTLSTQAGRQQRTFGAGLSELHHTLGQLLRLLDRQP